MGGEEWRRGGEEWRGGEEGVCRGAGWRRGCAEGGDGKGRGVGGGGRG